MTLEELEKKVLNLEKKLLVIEFLIKKHLPKNSDPGGSGVLVIEEAAPTTSLRDPRSEDYQSAAPKPLKTVLPVEDAKNIADALEEAQEARRGATEALSRANKAIQIAARKSDQMSRIELENSKKLK